MLPFFITKRENSLNLLGWCIFFCSSTLSSSIKKRGTWLYRKRKLHCCNIYCYCRCIEWKSTQMAFIQTFIRFFVLVLVLFRLLLLFRLSLLFSVNFWWVCFISFSAYFLWSTFAVFQLLAKQIFCWVIAAMPSTRSTSHETCNRLLLGRKRHSSCCLLVWLSRETRRYNNMTRYQGIVRLSPKRYTTSSKRTLSGRHNYPNCWLVGIVPTYASSYRTFTVLTQLGCCEGTWLQPLNETRL